jgi:hypothetical protein
VYATSFVYKSYIDCKRVLAISSIIAARLCDSICKA